MINDFNIINGEKKMTKKDLKNGMILETREGKRYLLLNGKMFYFEGCRGLVDYSDDLKYDDYKDCDIVKVYKETMAHSLITMFNDEYLSLIWERKEIKLTKREIEVLKALDVLGFKYIVRNRVEDSFTYIAKPVKDKSSWLFNGNDLATDMVFFRLKRDLFSFVTWEDKEPTSIKKLLEQVKEKEK